MYFNFYWISLLSNEYTIFSVFLLIESIMNLMVLHRLCKYILIASISHLINKIKDFFLL